MKTDHIINRHDTKLVVWFAFLIILAFVFRYWDLDQRAMHHDESLHALYSWYIASSEGFFGISNDKLEKYFTLCDEYSVYPATLALSWLLHNPVVTAPIIGPRIISQLDDALAAIEYKINKELLDSLDKIWPGPGGPAPEAYAW